MIFGAIIVALISIVGAILTIRLKNIIYRFIVTGIVALLAAYLVYWVPAWFGPNDDQYSSWSRLFIDAWLIVGFIAGAFTVTVTSAIKNSG